MFGNKGIIINGVWLGNNVTVNSLFNDLCSVAPFVLQDFIQYINKIENLEEAVEINKFEFPDNNTIEIAFSNSNFSGLANLYYRLQGGTPKLIDKNITFSALNEKTEISESNTIAEETARTEQSDNKQDLYTEEIIAKNILNTENDDFSEQILNEPQNDNTTIMQINKKSYLDENHEMLAKNSIENVSKELSNNESETPKEGISLDSGESGVSINNSSKELIEIDNIITTDKNIDNNENNPDYMNIQKTEDIENSSSTDENENYDIYDDCFADLYNSSNINQNNIIVAEENSNINMDAMLNEVMTLREELSKIKEIKPIWEKEESKNEISDIDADFRIMKDGTSHNASILDVDTFVAGNTLYKWGDTLYLED